MGIFILLSHQFMSKVDIFEDFIEIVSQANRNDTNLMCNSFYIINDERQRQKMTEEFYSEVKKEIAKYQERVSYFIDTGSHSPLGTEDLNSGGKEKALRRSAQKRA